MFRVSIAVIVVCVCLLSCACSGGGDFSDKKSYDLRFGVLREPQERKYHLTQETLSIPRCVFSDTGFLFGYIIQERSNLAFRLETVTHFPGIPRILTGDLEDQTPARVVKSPSRRINGSGASSFRFDEGDPSGIYKMEFYVDGRFLRSIEFEVLDSCEISKGWLYSPMHRQVAVDTLFPVDSS